MTDLPAPPPTADQAPPEPQPYVVRVAPAVLAIVVRRAVEQVPGVLRMGSGVPGGSALTGRPTYAKDGVRLGVQDGTARIAVQVVLERDRNLQTVGVAVQEAVVRALENLVGMAVDTIDVYVLDVA